MKRREKGQGLVEYALILVLVSMAVIILVTILGETVLEKFCMILQAFGGGCTESANVASMLQSENMIEGMGGISGLDAFYEFWDQNLGRDERLGEVNLQLQEAVGETLEVLIEYADQIGDEVLYSLVLQAQQVASEDYANLPSALEAVFDAIGETPMEVLVAVILKVEPNVIKSYWELDGAQVPYEAFEAALQEIQQLEDESPGSTGDAIPLMWEIWDTVAQGNFFIEEGQSAFKYIACMGITTLYDTEITEYIEIAQQFEAQLPPCGN